MFFVFIFKIILNKLEWLNVKHLLLTSYDYFSLSLPLAF
jgi:hypothetical protein